MAHPLDSAYLKLERAEEHLKAFDKGVSAFLADKPYLLTWEIDPKSGDHILWFEPTQEPPPKLAVLIGEIAFNLRSALDHTAYQMSLLKGCHSKNTAWPICFTEKAFRDRGQRMMKQIKVPEASALIEKLQPFKHPTLADRVPLALLSELCNVDKHRLLHLTRPYATTIGTNDITVGAEISGIAFGPFEGRAVLLKAPSPVTGDVNVELHLTLAFTEHIPRFAHSAHRILEMCAGTVAGILTAHRYRPSSVGAHPSVPAR